MIQTAQPAYRATRNKLLISCATVAIATMAVMPQKARAQAAPQGAFRGGITSDSGNVTRTPVTDTTETITIDGNLATINWNPTGQINTDGNMVFLPDGNVATFQGTA